MSWAERAVPMASFEEALRRLLNTRIVMRARTGTKLKFIRWMIIGWAISGAISGEIVFFISYAIGGVIGGVHDGSQRKL